MDTITQYNQNKSIKCPYCKGSFVPEEWNNKTKEHYKTQTTCDITKAIKEPQFAMYFKCPGCDTIIDNARLVRIKEGKTEWL